MTYYSPTPLPPTRSPPLVSACARLSLRTPRSPLSLRLSAASQSDRALSALSLWNLKLRSPFASPRLDRCIALQSTALEPSPLSSYRCPLALSSCVLSALARSRPSLGLGTPENPRWSLSAPSFTASPLSLSPPVSLLPMNSPSHHLQHLAFRTRAHSLHMPLCCFAFCLSQDRWPPLRGSPR